MQYFWQIFQGIAIIPTESIIINNGAERQTCYFDQCYKFTEPYCMHIFFVRTCSYCFQYHFLMNTRKCIYSTVYSTFHPLYGSTNKLSFFLFIRKIQYPIGFLQLYRFRHKGFYSCFSIKVIIQNRIDENKSLLGHVCFICLCFVLIYSYQFCAQIGW